MVLMVRVLLADSSLKATALSTDFAVLDACLEAMRDDEALLIAGTV
jgi:hypothetical protein